ncbi:MAG: DUF433 domain-containing protein [Heteroscytonema crispum UTEX LB 1556]
MTVSPTVAKRYIEQRDKGLWIEGTRVSLDSIVYAFLNGESPESIAQNFPLLSRLTDLCRTYALYKLIILCINENTSFQTLINHPWINSDRLKSVEKSRLNA